MKSPWLNREGARETGALERGRGKRNSWCSGEMRRDQEEHQRCRRLSGPLADAETRKRGEQTGLDTLVVRALNDADLVSALQWAGAGANALSRPPGEYGRKAETQRN